MKYRAEIDGLRALAVLPVILFHAGFEWFSGGFVGVDIFFVISGYLIATIIICEMAEDKFSIVNFYERRARRILPALFFVMAACLPFAWLWLTPSDLKDFGQSLVATAIFSSNVLFWWERGYFGTALELKPLLHTWSLAVEEQYYILFPIFLLLTWRLGLKKVLCGLMLCFVVSLGFAHFASLHGVYDRVITGAFYLIPTRAWELLLGVFAAFYLKYNQCSKSNNMNQILSLLGLSMIIYAIIFFDESTPFPSLFTLIPTVGTGLLILTAVPDTLVHKLLSCRLLVGIGLMSYSAYLWHQPIFSFARHKFSVDISELLFIFLSIASLIIAYISWKWVEKPFREKDKISRRGIFSFSIFGILFFVVIGSIFSLTDGLIWTYNKVEQSIYSEFINFGVYNSKNMKAAHLNNFYEEDDRIKLLVIGDSYAADLVNAIKESELDEKYQLSTYKIPARCGVLYIERERIQNFQANYCHQSSNFFNEPMLETLVKNSDEVWIASIWLNWQLEFLPESLSRLQKMGAEVILFGSKGFLITSASQYKNQYGLEGLQREFQIADEQKLFTSSLRNIANSLEIEYIDSMFVICGSYEVCRHSFDDGGVISVDGAHLTPYGARHFGSKLNRHLLNNGLTD